MKFLQDIHTYAKLIFINFIIFIILFFILDFLTCIYILSKESKTQHREFSIHLLKKIYINKIKFKRIDREKYINNTYYRPIENIDSKKKPILIFGGSFAYGYNLKDNETFSYQLGKLTGRPIYNRAYHGRAPQHMLYQLHNNEFYHLVPKPEYIIYVLIPEQIPRLYHNTSFISSYYRNNLFYKQKMGNLIRDKQRELLLHFSIFYLLDDIIHKRKSYNYKEIELLKLHFLVAQKEIFKHWDDDIKFIIILYDNSQRLKNIKPIIGTLTKNNFIIIDINNLSNTNFIDKKYQNGRKDYILQKKTKSFKNIKFDTHPNARAWKEITPLIVKELNL